MIYKFGSIADGTTLPHGVLTNLEDASIVLTGTNNKTNFFVILQWYFFGLSTGCNEIILLKETENMIRLLNLS